MRRRTIILSAAAVAAAFSISPAIAMPFIAPIIGIGASLLASTVFASTIVASLIGTAVSIGTSMLFSAIMKPGGAAPAPGFQPSGQGGVYIDQKQSIRQPAAPRRVIYGISLTGGVFGFLHIIENNQTLLGTIIWAGHPCSEIVNYRLAEETLTLDGDGVAQGDTRYAGVARFLPHLGQIPQAADAMLLTLAPSHWHAQHRGDGVTYSAFRFFWDNLTGPNFDKGSKIWSSFDLGNITAVVRGAFVYDPRSLSWVWTDNAALIIADYLTNQDWGIGGTVNWERVAAAATICDELVTAADGSQQKRYSINGYFDTDAQPDQVLGRMLGSMAGWATYDGEEWSIWAGAYYEPEFEITDDDMIQPSRVSSLSSIRDTPNCVRGTYVDHTVSWDKADFNPVRSSHYIAEDGGVERYDDIELPFTIFQPNAIRLAAIHLKRKRQDLVEQFVGRIGMIAVLAGETVFRTSTRYGWNSKPFLVLESELTTIEGGGEGDAPVLGVRMTLQEIDETIWDNDRFLEPNSDPAPNTDFPDFINPLPPTTLVLTERKFVSNDGAGVQVALDVSWTASADSFVERYIVAWRRLGSEDPNPFTFRSAVSSTADTIAPVAPGTYEVRVFSVNWLGVTGSTFSAGTIAINGLGDKPAAVTGFTVAPMGNVYANARWNAAPELDVLEGGAFHIRHSPLTAGASWADGRLLADPIGGRETNAQLPLLSGTYMIRKVDAVGVWSDTTTFVQTQQSVVDFTTAGGFELTEDPDFPGTLNGLVYDAATQSILIAGVDDFDSVPDVDALVVFDFPGGVATGTETAPAGYYEWSETVDIGSVKRMRLTVDSAQVVFDVFDDFDSREGEVDSWASWDGEVSGTEGDVWHLARTTADDPSGAPTWSEWFRADSVEIVARGTQLRTYLNSTDGVYNVAVSELSARFEVPV